MLATNEIRNLTITYSDSFSSGHTSARRADRLNWTLLERSGWPGLMKTEHNDYGIFGHLQSE
ncbi:MAG: hypothetical protein ACI814_004546, partial [Mariniblastus sp.]